VGPSLAELDDCFSREHEDRQRAELSRQDAPFRGVDYDKELHAGENEEDGE